MNIKNLNSTRLLEILFFVFCLFLFFKNWIQYFLLRFQIGAFDGALRLLSGLYASNGLLPYKDFSFLYPPGIVFLSQLFRFNMISYYQVLALISLILSILLVLFIFIKTKSYLYSGIFSLLLILNMNFVSYPLTDLIWLIMLTIIYFYLTEKRNKYLWFIFVLNFAEFWLKWEREVYLTLLLIIGWLVIVLLKYKAKEVLNLIKVLVLGIVSAVALLVLYFYVQGVQISNGFYFIFLLPFKIASYRHLPLPLFSFNIIYFSISVFAVFVIYLFPKLNKQNVSGFIYLMLVPIPMLFYVMGRADYSHSLPLFFTLTLAILLYSLKDKKILPLVFILWIYASSIFNLFSYQGIKDINLTYLSYLNNDLSDCRRLVKNTNYASIFVGRKSYTNYIIGYSQIYLINPKVKPATEYISDEPGAQNSCYDGQKVASELSRSQKPMLAFIDSAKQGTEDNATRNMKSCGKIENWLDNNKFAPVGSCFVGTNKFEVRLYK